MTESLKPPSEAELRAALSMLFPDADSLDQAIMHFANTGTQHNDPQIDGVDVDLQRQSRCGFPEVIFGEGKSTETILGILRAQQQAGQDSFVTRIRPDQVTVIQAEFSDVIRNDIARTIRLHRPSANLIVKAGPVIVITAGSSDRPVAEEAMETLRWMKIDCELIQDAGVAGPQRLLRHIPKLQRAAAIVCVAGMEAALPSIVGGYVPCPVIGVPTSVGYGASLNGITAMLSMLTCCASNVVSVNIDAGFKGGYVAGLIASRMNSNLPTSTVQALR
ncbi:MAG TPA: nickel pincer cofactor biosynthesis protein LarB [Planctomycetaceae bacterium]|nr:nickel pincer cofactor biosynthesis protein LarB [Planctomycetaceae bacterium]